MEKRNHRIVQPCSWLEQYVNLFCCSTVLEQHGKTRAVTVEYFCSTKLFLLLFTVEAQAAQARQVLCDVTCSWT